MKNPLAFVALGVALVAGCAPAAPGTGSAEDEQAVRDMATAYAAAWDKGDATAIGAMVTDDYHGFDILGNALDGRAALEKTSADQFAARPAGQSISITVSYVRFLSANAAAAGGTWTVAGPAGPLPSAGVWSATDVKVDGKWMMASNHAAVPAVMPAPMASDTAAVKK
ncbi:MAG: SgcJ/EcaC family oxidoreductase [Gemmatimonadota bacterium]